MKTLLTSIFITFLFSAHSQITFQRNYNIADNNSSDYGAHMVSNGNNLFIKSPSLCYTDNGVLACDGLIETNEDGDINWKKIIYSYQYKFQILDLYPLPGEGYYMSGSENSADGYVPFLMRLDENGDSLWLKHYPENVYNNHAYDVELLPNGHVIMLGSGSTAQGHVHLFLIEADAEGNHVRDTMLELGSTQVLDGSLAVLLNGDLAICYRTSPPSTSHQTLTLSVTDQQGNVQWTKEYQINESNQCTPRMRRFANGGYVLSFCIEDWAAGQKVSNFYGLDNEGNVLWEYEFPPEFWASNNIATTADGDVIGCGFRRFDNLGYYGWLFRISHDGEMLWQRSYRPDTPIVGDVSSGLLDLTETPDSGIAATGSMDDSLGQGTTSDIWLLKVDADGCLTPGCTEEVITFSTERKGGVLESVRQVYFRLSPNPVAGEARAAFFDAVPQGAVVKVFNGQGQLLRAYPAAMGSMEVGLDFSGHPAGLYSVVYEVEGRVLQVERVVRE